MATYPPEPLTSDEARRLIRACNPRWPTGLRNRALLAVLYRSGLRCAEALALRPWDLDAEAGTVRVLCGKGGKARTVGMDRSGFDLVSLWLVRREALLANLGITGDRRAQVPLFCTLQGGTIQTSYVRAMIKRMGRRAEISKRTHAHGLRHTMAAELRVEGVDIGVISKQLGHRNISTTSRYLDHVMPTAVIDAMRGREFTL